MQQVAREMNLSETSFLVRGEDGFDLRWFTPTVEVELCGHATLASAHVLWETGRIAISETVRFHTRSGLLTAAKRDEWIELDFPATAATPAAPPAGLVRALGVKPSYVGKNKSDYLLEVSSEEIVRGLRPDIGRLKTVPVRGVIVTARAGTGPFDFVSRFFAPAAPEGRLRRLSGFLARRRGACQGRRRSGRAGRPGGDGLARGAQRRGNGWQLADRPLTPGSLARLAPPSRCAAGPQNNSAGPLRDRRSGEAAQRA